MTSKPSKRVAPGGGLLRTLILNQADGPITKTALPEDTVDHRLIRAVETLQEKEGPPVVLITKDINLRIKTKALGFDAEDYENDKAVDPLPDTAFSFDITESQWRKLKSDKRLHLPELDQVPGLNLNQWIRVRAPSDETPVLYCDPQTVRLPLSPTQLQIPGGMVYTPRAEEQRLFLDLLLDESIPLITTDSKAGTGKTLTALAAALYAKFVLRRYDTIIISRPVIGLIDEDVGYLPGTIEEKLGHWLAGAKDNLDLLLTPKNTRHDRKRTYTNRQQPAALPGSNAQPTKRPSDALLESGAVQIQSLQHIRGRSLNRAILIVDELQNLKPSGAKTVTTRAGEGTKIICMGDSSQTDNPYLDQYSNGLTHIRSKLKNERLCAHMTLTKVHRSPLAELAANKL